MTSRSVPTSDDDPGPETVVEPWRWQEQISQWFIAQETITNLRATRASGQIDDVSSSYSYWECGDGVGNWSRTLDITICNNESSRYKAQQLGQTWELLEPPVRSTILSFLLLLLTTIVGELSLCIVILKYTIHFRDGYSVLLSDKRKLWQVHSEFR